MKLFFPIFLLGFLCSDYPTYAQHASIDKLVNEYQEKGLLNGSILVVQKDSVLYENAFGYAAGSKDESLTTSHRFNIGSIYKEFSAVAIMQLQERGKLNLNDKLSKHVKDLPSWANSISIKHLLQYSSGLPNIPWGEYFGKNLPISEADILNEINGIQVLEFEPGSDYLYTNYSPILLIRVVETLSGVSFTEYAQQKIFQPTGMEDIIIKPAYPYSDKTLMAIPFDKDFMEDSYNISVPSILFSTTPRDLYNWLTHLHEFQIITKTSLQFLSETVLKGDNIQAPLGYCNWEKEVVQEHSHHGSSGNYEAIARRFPDKDLTIILLTNQKHGNVYEISDAIFELVN